MGKLSKNYGGVSMKYFYLKTINNNAIVSINENHQEAIILGKAVGVDPNRHVGGQVNPSLIERVFTKNNEYIEPLLRDIPYSYYALVQWIMDYAEKEFNYDFKESLYLTLLDHIVFANKRYQEDEIIINPLLNEIKAFEREKYDFATKVVVEINNRLDTSFDENEVGFIAFHFVNAMSELSQSQNKKVVVILKELTDFLTDFLLNSRHLEIDQESYYFSRLITHLKYLFTRALSNKNIKNGGDDAKLIGMIKENFYDEWTISLEICAYLKNEYNIVTSEQEVAYITMHLLPILNNSKGEN